MFMSYILHTYMIYIYDIHIYIHTYIYIYIYVYVYIYIFFVPKITKVIFYLKQVHQKKIDSRGMRP